MGFVIYMFLLKTLRVCVWGGYKFVEFVLLFLFLLEEEHIKLLLHKFHSNIMFV